MFSRSAKAGNICLRCQLRLLEGPRPVRLLRHRTPSSPIFSPRLQRCYSSSAVWDRLESAIKERGDVEKKTKKLKAEWEKPEYSRSERPSKRPQIPAQDAAREQPTEDLYQMLARELEEETDAEKVERSDGRAFPFLQQEPFDQGDSASVQPEPPAQQNSPFQPGPPAPQNPPFKPAPIIGFSEEHLPREREKEHDTIHRTRIGARRVVLKPEGLDVTMLGEKAHTLVMRDDKGKKPRREILEDPNPPEASETTSADLRAFLAAAEAEPSLEEAIANIEELRPEGSLVLRSDFWALHHDLVEGFTNPQLLAYIAKQRKNASTKGAVEAHGAAQTPKGYTIRPLEKIEVTPDMSPKARKALALMIVTWKIDIWERVEGLSHVSITVKDPAVAMVLNMGRERNQRLEALRESLQDGESLVWNPEKKSLTIVARRAIIETIMDEVNVITDNITEGTVRLLPSAVSKSKEAMAVVQPLLDQLCLHTKATVGPIDTRSGKIPALWVKREEVADSSDFEDMAHVMWRLLYTAHIRPDGSTAILEDFQATGNGRLDLHTRNEERLPWKDRMTSWARWVLPVDREAPALGNVAQLASQLPAVEEMPPKDESDSLRTWSSSQLSMSTTFGHVLFESQQEHQDIKSILASTTPVPRILTPITPPPDGLKPLDPLLADTWATTTMVLRFAAGPDHVKTPLLTVEDGSTTLHPSSAARYIVELHLDVPDEIPDDVLTWDSSPRKSVHAVLATNHTDLPLPDRPVDVRITRTQTSTLADADSIPSFREFINSSRLDLSSGSLRTPSTLQISGDALAGLPASSKPSASESLEFLGLEVRRAVQLPYEGHTLSYSSVEAGLHGGRRAELSLAMTPAEPGADEAAHRQRYLDLAVSLAEGRLVHWGDGTQAAGEEAQQ